MSDGGWLCTSTDEDDVIGRGQLLVSVSQRYRDGTTELMKTMRSIIV